MRILSINPIDAAYDKCYVYHMLLKPLDKNGFISTENSVGHIIFSKEERAVFVSTSTKVDDLVKVSFLITMDYFRTSVKKFYDKFLFEERRTAEQIVAEEIFGSVLFKVFHDMKDALRGIHAEATAYIS